MFPISIYGCESWTMRKKDQEKIKSFEYWCYRRMLGISWTEKRTNLSITNELKLTTSLLQTIHQQQLSYFGHVLRGEGLEATIMLGMGE